MSGEGETKGNEDLPLCRPVVRISEVLEVWEEERLS
jgi:hypothetical protein